VQPAEASAWARSVHRCELEPTAASRLLELAGVNCGRLDSELSKLASYAAPRTRITVADVEEVVSSRREENVFALSDALGRRDAAAALDRWQQVLATDRAAPYRAVGGLAWAFRRCATARRLLDEGVPPMEAARRSGFYGNSDMMRQQIGPFNARQLEDFLICLLRIDVGTKTGLGSTERAVEKLVVEMCGMPAAKDRK
jgi:DNA polymerase III delta subunit